MYTYLDEKHASDRKSDMTNEQFYYKTRKNAVGLFKKQTWNLPANKKAEIGKIWEEQFSKLFKLLGLTGTRDYVEKTVQPVIVKPDLNFYLGGAVSAEEVSDLAD
jgi:hypothetical protein